MIGVLDESHKMTTNSLCGGGKLFVTLAAGEQPAIRGPGLCLSLDLTLLN